MVSNTKKTTSWVWIIFWFVLFWPIGLFLLLRKISADRSVTLKDGQTVAIISYILIGLGVIYLAGDMPLLAIFLIGAGIWVNYISRKMKLTGERYKKYIVLIVNQSQTSIDNIASIVGLPYEAVMQDLQKMIDAGYFDNAHIDIGKREIVLVQAMPQQTSQIFVAQTQEQVQERLVTCESCGANNRILGQIGKCEYCDSLLQ